MDKIVEARNVNEIPQERSELEPERTYINFLLLEAESLFWTYVPFTRNLLQVPALFLRGNHLSLFLGGVDTILSSRGEYII